MKKDARIEFRIPQGSKARWEGAAEGHGYPSLAAFIVDTIESVHFETQNVVATVIPIGVASSGGGEPGTQDHEVVNIPSSPAAPPSIQIVFGPSKTQCPSEAKHRKGIFCKWCNKVPR